MRYSPIILDTVELYEKKINTCTIVNDNINEKVPLFIPHAF